MSIYVISNDLNSKNNLFKIGRTKDTNTEIVTKYQRYLPCARLLLWYPSTNYVSHEKELLQMFKLNRGSTPNGFRNEWLKISFVELKSKLDVFFGFSGDDFEEEQKQNKERKRLEKEEKMPTCEYCSNSLSNNQSLKRHHLTCKKKNKYVPEIQLQFERDQYEQQIQNLKYQYEQQLQTQQLQIEKLESQIEKLENQIFEIAKQPKSIPSIFTV
jgi:hypothetical protein